MKSPYVTHCFADISFQGIAELSPLFSSSYFQFLHLEAKTVGAAVSEAHVDGILKERILEDCPQDTAQSDKEHDVTVCKYMIHEK